MRRKNKTPIVAPTPADRINAANERTGTALFVFEQAASELEAASSDFAQIQDDLLNDALTLREQARALEAQADAAIDNSDRVAEQAARIRGLIGSTTGTAA